jgi:hypothetical protein
MMAGIPASRLALVAFLLLSSCGAPVFTEYPEGAVPVTSSFEADRVRAVARALEWLARNQEPDGRWDASRHGGGDADPAVTGLALMALTGGGNTETRGKYSGNIRRGTAWLLAQQADNGQIGADADNTVLLNHPIAAAALAQVNLLSKSETMGKAVRKATEFTARELEDLHRRGVCMGDPPTPPYLLPWYAIQVRMQGISTMGISMARDKWRAADKLLFKRKDVLGPVSPDPNEYPGREETVGSLYCRMWITRLRRGDPAFLAAAKYLVKLPPRASEERDYQYLLFADYVLFEAGGALWREWCQKWLADLLSSQLTEGEKAGTWDSSGPGGGAGGRVFSTALAAICFEWVYCGHYPKSWNGLDYDGPHRRGLPIARPSQP